MSRLPDEKRLLLVGDHDDVRAVFQKGLEAHGFEVVAAATVNEALRLISTEKFDVLLSDLHMPDAGDGFTVVSAMRHAHPNAVTLVLSSYPALQEAMAAILLEADEVLVKPVGLAAVAEVIQKKLSNPSARMSMKKERVAEILERDAEPTIRDWMSKVERNDELTGVSLSYQERTGHLPLLLGDLVRRLRLAPNAKLPNSAAAREHGIMRRKQGYTVAMAVEESRILQVSIFRTLQNNLRSVDFSSVLLDVMTIADEVDSQLKQAMLGFMDPPPPLPCQQVRNWSVKYSLGDETLLGAAFLWGSVHQWLPGLTLPDPAWSLGSDPL
jgi:DNA-binding response OmpR family regulator